MGVPPPPARARQPDHLCGWCKARSLLKKPENSYCSNWKYRKQKQQIYNTKICLYTKKLEAVANGRHIWNSKVFNNNRIGKGKVFNSYSEIRDSGPKASVFSPLK